MSQVVKLVSGKTTLVIKTVRPAATGLIVDVSLTTSTPDTLSARRLARYDTTDANVVATLPLAASVAKDTVIAAINEVGANVVNVTRSGSDTINSVAGPHVLASGVGKQFISNGITNWTAL